MVKIVYTLAKYISKVDKKEKVVKNYYMLLENGILIPFKVKELKNSEGKILNPNSYAQISAIAIPYESKKSK